MIPLDTAQQAIEKALGTAPFDVPSGASRPLMFYKGEMPAKRSTDSPDDDAGYCFLSPGTFRVTRQGVAQQVRATFVLYTHGSKADGLAMVADTITKLAALADATFTPCALVGDIEGTVDNMEHPYYWLEIVLQLTTTR